MANHTLGSLQSEWLQIVVNSLAQTISQYTHIPTAAGLPENKAYSHPAMSGAAACIRFEGEPVSLELFLLIPDDLFTLFYQNVFNEPFGQTTSGSQDLAGELLNISFGMTDPQARAQGWHLKSSLPVHLTPSQLGSFAGLEGQACLVVPYMAAGKTFDLTVFAGGTFKQKWVYTR